MSLHVANDMETQGGILPPPLLPANPAPAEVPAFFNEYPGPLTTDERETIQRHLGRLLKRYYAIHHRLTIVQQGYEACQALVQRLEGQKRETELELERMKSGAPSSSTATAPPSVGAVRKEEASNASDTAPPRRKLRIPNSMFARMQDTLRTANQQAIENQSVMEARERISKETSLKLLTEDLETQSASLAPLKEKYEVFLELHTDAKERLKSVITLWDEITEIELRYASSFTLHVPASSTVRVPFVQAEEGYVLHQQRYSVPFRPAVYTPQVEQKIRDQIDTVLPDYLDYRSQRVDPLLMQIEMDEAERRSKKLDYLKEVVGLGDTNVVDWREMAAESTTGGDAVLGSEPNLASGDRKNGEETKEESDERGRIQSALAALDDFEED